MAEKNTFAEDWSRVWEEGRARVMPLLRQMTDDDLRLYSERYALTTWAAEVLAERGLT